jgi:hypothetical protein
MSKDDHGHLLTLRQVKQFACTGAQHLLILIRRTGLSLRGEGSLPGDRVDGEEHRTGFGKTHQNRLVSRHMSTAFNQFQSGEQLSIPFDQPVT